MFSQRWLCRVISSGIKRRIVRLKSIDVSEEHVASIFKLEESSKRETKRQQVQFCFLPLSSWVLASQLRYASDEVKWSLLPHRCRAKVNESSYAFCRDCKFQMINCHHATDIWFWICHLDGPRRPGWTEIEWDTSASGLRWWRKSIGDNTNTIKKTPKL
jgi:hypothetical protein